MKSGDFVHYNYNGHQSFFENEMKNNVQGPKRKTPETGKKQELKQSAVYSQKLQPSVANQVRDYQGLIYCYAGTAHCPVNQA